MLVGINFNAVSAKVEENRIGAKSINVNSTPKITGVEKAEILDMKDVLRVKFDFVSKYEPEVGEITLSGNLLWRNPDAKKVLKIWEDEKKLETKAAVEILNAIFRKCLAKALVLAEDVRLPPPVQIPIVREKVKV